MQSAKLTLAEALDAAAEHVHHARRSRRADRYRSATDWARAIGRPRLASRRRGALVIVMAAMAADLYMRGRA